MSKPTQIARGIHFLQTRSFVSLGPSDNAVILDALQDVGDTNNIKQRIASVLTKQFTQSWIKRAALADVCRIATALHYYDETYITGKHLACIVQRLIDAESEPGGPYINQDGKLDVATNGAVAAFVHWAASDLPNVTAYLEEEYNGQQKWHHYRDIACMGTDAAKPPADLMHAKHLQQADGSWPATGQFPSKELMTAIMVHICALNSPAVTEKSEYAKRSAAIFDHVQAIYDTHGPVIAAQARTMLARMQKANKNYEITLLPMYFGKSLRTDAPYKVYTQLGMANLFCWVAYTAYDHILDKESDVTLLPLANISMRAALQGYMDMCNSDAMRHFVRHIFDRMDQANAWELTCARLNPKAVLSTATLPAYEDLSYVADRSLGHILGPLILADRYTDKTTFEACQTALTAYLVARQLNDDVHDWCEDSEAGIITYVVTRLAINAPKTVTLIEHIPAMQQLFWDRIGYEVSACIADHITKATNTLRACNITPSDGLQTLLDTIASSAHKAQTLREDSDAFLENYADTNE